MTGPAAGPPACTYPVPATAIDGAVTDDGTDGFGRQLWRALCRCGWEAGGYMTGAEAWRGIDKHRAAAAAYRSLEPGNRRRRD